MVWPISPFVALSLFSLSHLAWAGPYDGFTTTALIKWRDTATGPFDFTELPRVSTWFSIEERGSDLTSRLSFVADTGTCGIVTAMEKVNIIAGEKTAENRGYQWLSSSKILYVGWWVERYVWFNNDFADRGSEVKAKVKVLAMEKILRGCEGWVAANGDTCPGSTEDVTHRATQLMGIGWGRMHDGQPQGSPDKNPLLNIVKIAGISIDPTRFHPGWTIDPQGVTVGLTNSVWEIGSAGSGGSGIIDIDLGDDPGAPPPSPASPPHLRSWGEAAGCVSVAGSTCVESTILLDTGLDYASIRMPSSIVRTLARYNGTILNDGQAVIIRLGRPGTTPRDLETFTYPHTPWPDCDITPLYAKVYQDIRSPPRFPFANTGRHAYRRWSTGLDPVRGVSRFVPHSLVPSLLTSRLDDPLCTAGPRCSTSCPCHVCS